MGTFGNLSAFSAIYGYISGFWDIRAAKNKKSYSKMKEKSIKNLAVHAFFLYLPPEW